MNVRELLDDLRVTYREHGESPHVSSGWVGLVCPFCGGNSGKYGLGINLRYGSVSCWKCGRRSLAEVLAAVTGQPLREIRSQTARIVRERVPERPAGTFRPPDGVGPLERPHRRYLERRGFDPDELVRLWEIGGIGIATRLSWRIYIPVHQHGQIVSWTTRAASENVPHEKRYLAAPAESEAVPRRSVLFGEDYVRFGTVVHEGYFDVFATGPGAVCLGGMGWSDEQVSRLGKIPVRAIAFDDEPAAQRRARQLARELEPYPGTTAIVRLSVKDAGTDPANPELRELRKRFLE